MHEEAAPPAKLPAEHVEQALAPTTSLYWPLPQYWHVLVADAHDPAKPNAQLRKQEGEGDTEKNFVGLRLMVGERDIVNPFVAEREGDGVGEGDTAEQVVKGDTDVSPLAHVLHTVAPLEDIKKPVAQSVHTLLAVAALNFPASQVVQLELVVWMLPAYRPVPHAMQSDDVELPDL